MDGATAFAKFYFARLNEGFRSGESRHFRELSSATCQMCTALANGIDEVRASRQHYADDLVKVRYASASEFTDNNRRVTVWADQKRVEVLGASGRHIETTRAARLLLVMTLEFREHWVVARLQRASS